MKYIGNKILLYKYIIAKDIDPYLLKYNIDYISKHIDSDILTHASILRIYPIHLNVNTASKHSQTG